MKINNNIFSKFLLLLVLIVGWGGSAWAQTSQLPLASGIYEIKNISGEKGSGTGQDRGYLVSFTGHNSGLGLAEVGWSNYAGIHPNNRNNGSTTCSYWYVHHHENGTYTIVSLSTLNGNTQPRYIQVGSANGQKSNLVNTEVELYLRDQANYKRDGYNSVLITNESNHNIFLSGGCGTNSNNGSAQASSNGNTDGGVPWLFISVPNPESLLSTAQLAIRDKYLERFARLTDNVDLVFVDGKGNPLPDNQVVVYTPTSGSPVNLTKASSPYDFGDVLYNPAQFSVTGADQILNTSYDVENHTLTFTITTDPYYINYSAEPTNGQWADGTNWFTIRNNRNAKGFLSTQDNGQYLDANANLTVKNGADAKGDRGGLWAFVTNGSGINIYNNAYGPDFILGITGSGGGARMQMYPKDNIPSGVTTLFSTTESNVTDGFSHGYCFVFGTSGSNHLNEQNGYPGQWNPNNVGTMKGDGGSSFRVESVDADLISALPKYDVYKSIWEGSAASGTITYGDASKVFGKRGTANDGNYLILQAGSPVAISDFNISLSDDDYMVQSVSVKEAPDHYYQALRFYLKDKKATEEWTMKLPDAYAANFAGLAYTNGEHFYLRPNVAPMAIDFTINAPADKFVWGPVIDAQAKTVTYEVRDLATELTTGWYQMQLNLPESEISNIASKIKMEEGNINNAANTLYVQPSTLDAGAGRSFKISGIPLNGDEASTFVYIEKNQTQIILTNPRTGEQRSATAQFNDGVLELSTTNNQGWNIESNTHPLEGPYITTGAYPFRFNLCKIDEEQYRIYKLNFTGSDAASALSVSVNNADVLGNKTVKNGGYIIMPASANPPLRSQFAVSAGTGAVSNIDVRDAEGGVIPIDVSITARQIYWRAKITGTAKNADDRVIYKGINYVDDALIAMPFGTTPTAIDFKTNVEDRFVWGPILDDKLKTVTFEVREAATSLTAGNWYQMVLRDKVGQVFNGSVQNVQSMVDGINTMNTLRQKSNYIYPITSGTPDWTIELTGLTGSEMETQTYVYISRATSTGVTMMMQNGRYVNNNGQGTTNSNENLSLIYQDATKSFKWNTNALPWNTLANNKVGIGNTRNASNGNMEYFITPAPVKAYKIVGLNGNKARYTGETATCLSNNILTDGFFFIQDNSDFERSAGAIEISKFTSQHNINSITETTENGISVLTFSLDIPAYGKEIVHRQAHYYDELENESNLPQDGFIKPGEGLNSRQGTNGTIIEQNTAVYEIPVYLKQGTSFTSYMPTDQVKRYQRWYNWDTDQQVDDAVLSSLSSWNISPANTYTNGHLTGTGYGEYKNDPTLTLPVGMKKYNVGLDMAHYPTRGNIGSGLVEPTLAMRIVYQVRDAKDIAKAIKDSTTAKKFFETHNISFPNVKRGNLEDKTIGNLMPLDMDLNNYWIFDGATETDAELLQLLQSGGARLEVELGEHSEGAELKNVMMINNTANAASGNINFTSFNAGHFVLFQYPDGGVVPAGSTATVNVYITNNNGSRRYNLAQFNLTFIGNSEPVAVTELLGSHRHPNALTEAFGAPVAELTFDNKTNNEFGSFYRYPLDYKGVSYAFGTMVSGGGHTGWFASRGEYGLGSEYASSKALGGGSYKYYPVNNYLRNMGNIHAAHDSKETDSYCLYIDAADQPGKVASIQLEDALCAGSRLYCYGYIGCTSGGTDQNPTSVLINVMGINKETGEEELVYSYCPGIITLRAYDKDNRRIYAAAMGRGTVYEAHGSDDNYWAPWQQIGFSFSISSDIAARMKSYSIQIVNNAWNSNGADTMLDDFEIYVKKPGAEVQNTTPLCSDQIRHIKVITEYQTLIEATGADTNHDGLINVGFCFLDKEVYDRVLEENADMDAAHGVERTDPNNKYNKAFGEALMGNRTLDRTNKDHAFHNFDIVLDGAISNIYGENKVHYYTDIPQYSFKESGDDVVYRDSIRGERYIVFKESVAHGEASGIENHKWTAGKSYYLLFSTASISEQHVNNHDLGCTVFNLDDNRCAVLHEFTVAPPVSIKGDVEQITSGDEVQACAGQTATLTVNLNGRTETQDIIIKNLNYDWWMGYVSHKPMELEYGVPKYYDENGHAIYIEGADDVEYNTLPATMQNYMNVWHGKYQQDNVHLSKKAGDKIYLCDALLEFRRAYPNATDLVGVVPVHKTGDTVEYELTQDMIDCVAHFLQADPESGITPLILMKKEANLSLGTNVADANHVVHFVVIPIAPSIYSVDEDAIYCPDPQELKINLLSASPSLANGFDDLDYPEALSSIPLRVGLQQLNAVRHRASGDQRTLKVPLRKSEFAYPEVGHKLVKTIEPVVYIVGSDDPAYKKLENISKDITVDSQPDTDTDIEDMFINAGQIVNIDVEKGTPHPSMQIYFNNNVTFREGYTYTLKVKYYEVKTDDERDMACEGSFVFDMKVVPEYQVWTGRTGNSDWSNDRNWARADRADLYAGSRATGSKMTGATALNDETSYASNADNTTDGSFVPMYFTNVLFNQNDAVVLYKGDDFKRAQMDVNFLKGLKETSTQLITYDLSVTPVNPADRTSFNYDCNYTCELFDTYVANGVTFAPGTQMGNAHYLTYNKAWVEYLLDANRWYTLGSPLKNSYAGDWYSPTAGAKEMSPYFYDIKYREDINDRFRPAYYQRSWDRNGNNVIHEKSGGTYDAYVKADWSNVYNDAKVNYSAGGFSVKAELDYMDTPDMPQDNKVLVRLPKADESYTYYDVAGQTGAAANALIGSRTESYRLLSDDLNADGTGTISMTVSNQTKDNNFLLLSNPFMASMDMDKFFAANSDLEQKYWIVTADRQDVSVKSAADGEWLTTGAGGKYIAPLQGFFVKIKESADVQNSITARYTAQMQTIVDTELQTRPSLRMPATRGNSTAPGKVSAVELTAERGGASSKAIIVLSDKAHDAYIEGEDCETFIDGNLYAHPTVYTSVGNMAQTINVRQTLVMVPVGIISADDSETTMRINLSDDLSGSIYLYDSQLDTYTPVADGTEVQMSGNNTRRYFLTTSIDGELEDATTTSQQTGVWTPSGIYCGQTAKGLQPGLYIVDGVKMMVK